MRQVADCSKGLVVLIRAHVVNPAAQCLPQCCSLCDLLGRVVGQGREDEGAVLVKRSLGMVYTRLGFASDRVGR